MSNMVLVNKKVKFCEFIKVLRVSKELPLREVASILDIDISTLSKIEKGERNASKEMVRILASFFGQNYEDMLIMHLSDKVAHELMLESCSSQVLKVAEEKIEYIRNK